MHQEDVLTDAHGLLDAQKRDSIGVRDVQHVRVIGRGLERLRLDRQVRDLLATRQARLSIAS
jgi:hypothetical protein